VRALAVAISICTCCGGGADATPEGTVRELSRLLAEEGWDPAAREKAFALLDPRTRRELTRRAREASAAGGKALRPHEMIVPGGTTLRFEVTKVRVVDERVDRATVEVRGSRREKAELRLVREGDAWRVVLPLGGAS
jgi:hypothetical protein